MLYITEFSAEPDVMQSFSRPDGQREIWLRRNIKKVEKEDGEIWTAEEVMFVSNLSDEEIIGQADSYFIPDSGTDEDYLRAIIDYNLMMGTIEDPSEEE